MVAYETKFNDGREWTAAQAKYYYDDLFNRFCDYNVFMEAYNGLHDEVNTYDKPVSPEVPFAVSPETPQ